MKILKKITSVVLAATMIITICPQTQIIDIQAKSDSTKPYNISYGRPVYASSQDSSGVAVENAVDGDESTRWQAKQSDQNEWLYVDLGAEADIDHIYLHWEAARAKYYEIQFSNDEDNWTTVYTKGKQVGAYVNMAFSYKVNSLKDGYAEVSGEWTSVENAKYKVYDGDTIAKAPDNYDFKAHGGTQGNFKLSEGKHTIKVVAFNPETNAELGSATCEVKVVEGGSGDNGVVVDTNANLKQTIEASQLSAKKARYVKVVTTERVMNYGSSLYEFQVYGTNGVVRPPKDYGENLALNKPVKSRTNTIKDGDKTKEVNVRDEWWMYDSDGNIKQDAYDNVKPENAVDGKTNTSFTSYQGDDQWIYVDLQKEYTLGRVVINWNSDAGKIYDVEVSSDAKNWKTVHRVQKGYANMTDNFTMYQKNVRYVRVLGYTKVESGSGFGISELSVYEYVDGGSKENETISELPKRQIVNNKNGKGSYVSGEMYNEKNKLPTFVNPDTIKTPIDSNSWWSSAMVQTFSNLLCSTPLKASFSKKGLGVLLATAGWVGTRTENDLGTDQSTETTRDFYITPENLDTTTAYDRVESYGDYSVQLGLMDEDNLQMKSTIVKGSPYIFNEFCDNTVAFLSGSSITEFFDGNGNKILTKKGDTLVTDHIGFETVDDENTKANNEGTYFELNAPAGTEFKVMIAEGNYKIKITFPSKKDNYMSVAGMTKKGDIEDYYKHGYAFVTDTKVGYTYGKDNSKIVTTYTATTKLMRAEFSNVTMHCLFPHQWKHTNAADTPYATYPSIRGDMKSIWANEYKTTQQFSGLLPTFAKSNSSMFNSSEMIEYLNQVVASKINTAPVSDAYWEGKNVHPLAISALMADQLGETEIKEKLLKKLKSIMVDWFNYDGGDDRCYLIYNKDWGTLYYPDSSYGANAAICDHHFTYGYFMFGAAVLAAYDKQFYNDYKDMIELLVRDYADPYEPKDDGNMFCKFRAFDQYSGHSWAGGYADSDSGNNQESASEALFSWVGMYLWGEATQNQTYIDAGAYGFTTEMDAVEQYWFDYDETNWLKGYPFQAAGQIYGASMGYGTYFGGQPVYVYGIQWLPISEYLTNYGMNQAKCAKIYKGLEDDTQYAINIEKRLFDEDIKNGVDPDKSWHNPDNYVTPDTGWQHITWPFLSQTNAQSAYDKFEASVSKVQTEDRANTLWFISAMDEIGHRTNDYMVVGNIQGSVYIKDGKYTAEVWNPTGKTQTVTIKKADGTVAGTAKIGSMATVAFNIDTAKKFDLTQAGTPVIKATALADGKVTNNVTGTTSFDDTQLVELNATDEGAKIYYTTDGTVPTTKSKLYTDKILVSSDTTIKAIAVKDNCINSAYASAVIKINGDVVQSSDNLSIGSTATASTEKEPAAKAIDGDGTTRWQAELNDDEWLQVDLGRVNTVNTVKINWEAAYAEKYEIQVSKDGERWTTVAKENGLVGEITSSFPATQARYVRMQGVKRGTAYGYSIYEMEVYGALQAEAPVITPVSGTYSGEQKVTMSTSVKGAEVKYTLDGTTPTEDSKTYTAPITINKSTIVRAVTYRKGMLLSDPTESSIIIAGTIALNKDSAKIAIDRTVQLSALTNESVIWTSSNGNIAAVDKNGLVTGKSVGTAKITTTTASGKTATCNVTVTEPIHIVSISIPETFEIRNRTSETLELKINPEDTTDDTTAKWESSDEHVLTVNENGTITAKGEGEATVKVTVGKFTAECKVTVGPTATNAELVASSRYNAALKKNVTAYPEIAEGNISYITDGALSAGGNHAALGKKGWNYSGECYAIIDLGDTYDASTIDQVIVQYKDQAENDTVMNKKYEIQYSTNGIDYNTVYTSDTVTAADVDKDNCIVSNVVGQRGGVRYVKVYYPKSAGYGIQICEIGVISTEQNLKTIEVENCADPKDFTVTSDKICEIEYTITPGENQEGYKYAVYVDGIRMTDLIEAGSGVIKDVAAGTHKVQVIAFYNGLTSKGITKEVDVDDGSLVAYVGTTRNLSKGAAVTVEDIESEHEEGSKDPQTLTDGVISTETNKVIETVWGSKTATITIDLGSAIDKKLIDEVLLAFKANNTNATEYNIEFSEDGTKYEKVIDKTNVEYKAAYEDKFDADSYSKYKVRYVKVNLTNGNANWGYQISEISIMGTDVLMPVEAKGLVVTSPGNNLIRVSWTGETNQLYSVYIDGALKGMDVTAGTYTYNGIDAGVHTVRVTAKLNDIESKGVSATVSVEAGPQTTVPVTTEAPTTKLALDETTEAPTAKPSTDVTTEAPTEPSSDETTEAPTTKPSSDATTAVPTKIATDVTTKANSIETTKVDSVTTVSENKSVKLRDTKVKKATKKKAVKKIKITLKKVIGATHYQVKVSTSKKFKGKKKVTITKIVKKSTSTIKIKKLKSAKKYYVKARAMKKSGSTVIYGKWSKRKTVKIK